MSEFALELIDISVTFRSREDAAQRYTAVDTEALLSTWKRAHPRAG